jgi:tRNA/rRNA methyltransferase
MLENIDVILFRPKYPENIGSVARACLNMGCGQIVLVDPRNWDQGKALPLATHHAGHLLENVRIHQTLAEALATYSFSYGTTARTGGWRQAIQTPEEAAQRIMEQRSSGGKVAIVFGPEDKGLTNEETDLCNQLLTIPTTDNLTSLNLSQAVMVVLYECFKKSLTKPFKVAGQPKDRYINSQEREVLFNQLRETLIEIDFLNKDNPDYFMLPLKRFFNRINPRLNEYNLLMGLCRQMRRIVGIAKNDRS